MASDAIFRFGNPGRRSETWGRPPRFAATSVTRGLWTPRGWVARIELERVLFPFEKAKVWASSEPKSRGPSAPRRRHVSDGFSLGIQVTGTYVRAPPPRGYQTAPRFAPATGVTEAKRGVGRHVSPRDQGYRSETWRRASPARQQMALARLHVSLPTLVSQGAWRHPTPRFLVDPG